MSVETIVQDELLPLSSFASDKFEPSDLAKKRLLISQGEMVKLIEDYETATSIELVTLVNDNYKEFLQVSTGISNISERLKSLKNPLPVRYKNAVDDVSDLSREAHKLKSEAQLLADTREDVALLTGMISTLRSIDIGLQQKEVSLDDIGILGREYERMHALIEGTHAVLAEGARRGSPLLRECLLVVREDASKLKVKLIDRLLLEAERSLANCEDSIVSVYDSMARLQARSRFVLFLRMQLVDARSMSIGLEELVSEMRKKYMNEKGRFFRLACILKGKVDMWVEVLFPAMNEMLIAPHNLRFFIPTVSNLDDFFMNYNLIKDLLCDIGHFSPSFPQDRLLCKFKVSIYFTLMVKPVLSGVSRSNLAESVKSVFGERILIVKSLTGKAVQATMEMFSIVLDSIRKGEDKLGIISDLRKVVEVEISEIENFFFAKRENLMSAEKIIHLLGIQKQIFSRQIDAYVQQIVNQAAAGPVQTLESVKQISALYRVASRGFPTRPSAYVDLALKPVSSFLASLEDEWLVTVIGHKVVKSVKSFFSRQAKELLNRENARATASATETDKMACQLYLDAARLVAVLPRSPGDEETELNQLIETLKIVYVKNFPQ